MDRRTVNASAGAPAAALALVPGRAFAQPAPANANDARLNALFEDIFQRAVARSPELATQLGLDRGANADRKHKLSDRTPEERARLRDVGEAVPDVADAVAPGDLRLNVFRVEHGTHAVGDLEH